MIHEQIYLNTEQLAVNCKSHKLYTYDWDFAIYKALFAGICNNHSPNELTKYNEWKIDHNMRTNKTITKKNIGRLTAFIITNTTPCSCLIKAKFVGLEQTTYDIFVNSFEAFIPNLWQFQNPLGETILKYEKVYNIRFTATLFEFQSAIDQTTFQSRITLEAFKTKCLYTKNRLKFHKLKLKIYALQSLYLYKINKLQNTHFMTNLGEVSSCFSKCAKHYLKNMNIN